ncbi:hypothetical protein SSS_06171 [Sarcoptes scabiei]|nr:hypothetical protein SSS_06171 [Sarcoptes scabiei]
MTLLFIFLPEGLLGGTFGAVITCPLEVVKTRLQSSVAKFHNDPRETTVVPGANKGLTIWNCIRHIIKNEGPKAIFKGLGPNIIGVAPSRAFYFCTYSEVKAMCNKKITPDTPYVHMISAACAGFVSCTMTNPIWFIKTRMQLDQSLQGLTAWTFVKNVYKEQGISAFYKGITASYFGISETIIHFVVYEFIKSKLFKEQNDTKNSAQPKSTSNSRLPSKSLSSSSSSLSSTRPVKADSEQTLNFFQYMAAAAISKSIASFVAYPHEVARTRLREEGTKYRKFFQTIKLVYTEEGLRNGLYRGLATQLIRQIPNTAIMMGTYEVVVHFMNHLPLAIHNEI